MHKYILVISPVVGQIPGLDCTLIKMYIVQHYIYSFAHILKKDVLIALFEIIIFFSQRFQKTKGILDQRGGRLYPKAVVSRSTSQIKGTLEETCGLLRGQSL